jgi:anti-anti-sigma factor
MSTTEDRRADLDPGELRIDVVSAEDGSPVIFLSGEIDASTAGRLAGCFRAVADAGAEKVTIGFGEVTFMDSSGLNAVLELRRRLDATAQVHLRECSPKVRQMCEITGLDRCEGITVA